MESVRAKCSECGAVHEVIPPTAGRSRDPEGETPRAGLPEAQGAPLGAATRYGTWSCKECGATNHAPELDSSLRSSSLARPERAWQAGSPRPRGAARVGVERCASQR